MTRFARAKGSKASNERLPEEATTWAEMKQQLDDKKKEAEESSKRKEVEKQRQENYKNFLNKLEEAELKSSNWAEIPETQNSKKRKNSNSENGPQKAKNLKRKSPKKPSNTDDEEDEDFDALKEKLDKLLENGDTVNGGSNDAPAEVSSKTPPKNTVPKKAKKPKQKKQVVKIPPIVNSSVNTEAETEKTNSETKEKTVEPKKIDLDNLTEEERKKVLKKKEKRLKQMLKKKEKLGQKNEAPNKKGPVHPKLLNKKETNKTRSNEKQKNDKDHSRKKPQLPNQMTFNGEVVDVDYVDGFPVKKEDAERLKVLRKQMISKGLPASEIKKALKLERRKAEKAFARLRKKVCFNCRGSGHNISECPNLGKDKLVEAGSGICYKCGSTEHTHYECKVVRGDSFNYATCFICHAQGHISKQCPDNPRGIYPKGGACNVCGDVTHLKKDCPEFQAKQQEEQIKGSTIDENNPDVLDNEEKPLKKKKSKPNKVVKF